jgi:YesN/AraC family two-component response regulator
MPPANQYTVLVVDDERGLRRSLDYFLMDEGFRVLTAVNGREAIKLLSQQTVDLMLTDILMPETDGIELISYVKNHFPQLKTIVYSGGDLVYLTVSKDLGADSILEKPFDNQILKSTIYRLLGLSEPPSES